MATLVEGRSSGNRKDQSSSPFPRVVVLVAIAVLTVLNLTSFRSTRLEYLTASTSALSFSLNSQVKVISNVTDPGINCSSAVYYSSSSNWTERKTVSDANGTQRWQDTQLPKSISTENNTFINGAKNSDRNETTPALSGCLLIKDDNEILNEWIAYHYHLWNLRHLVVAVDPSSKTSPQSHLDRWSRTFSEFDYLLWQDSDYMPSWFLEGGLSRIKTRMGKLKQKFQNKTFTSEEIEQISAHRFRQREFYKMCLRYFDERPPLASFISSQWIIHIDTDEYLTLNPWLLESQQAKVQTKRSKLLNTQPMAGALIRLLDDDRQSKEDPSPCYALPRLLFGGIDKTDVVNATIPVSDNNDWFWNVSLLESIRWKFHAPMVVAGPLNGQPKALLDLQIFRDQDQSPKRQQQHDSLMNNVQSIHQPSQRMCPKRVSMDGSLRDESSPPTFTIYHFLGSKERYLAREDPRRNEQASRRLSSSTFFPLILTHITSFPRMSTVPSVPEILGKSQPERRAH